MSENNPNGNFLAPVHSESGDPSSFPVLQAFQKYIDQERAQSKKRIFQLSLCFSVILVLVIVLFIAVGVLLMGNSASLQSRLLDAVLSRQNQQAALTSAQNTQPHPPTSNANEQKELSASLRQLAQAAASLQSDLRAQKDAADASSKKWEADNAQQANALEALKQEMERMKKEGEQLKQERIALEKKLAEAQKKKAVPAVLPQPTSPVIQSKPVAIPQTQPVTRPNTQPAAAAKQQSVSTTPPPPAPVKPAVEVPAKATAVPPPPPVRKFPEAVKDPPSTPAGIKPPAAPNGMMSTSIPLKTKEEGTVRWRAIIPE